MKIAEILKRKKTLSFEVFPPKKDSKDIDSLYKTIDELALLNPDWISVTYGAGGNNTKNTVAIASYVKNKANIEALAHLTGGPSSPEDVDRVCEELIENNIENILALRGDKPIDMDIEYLKHFKYASELQTYISNKYDNFCLGGACYPEGHSECESLYEDILNLKIKQDAGAKFFITQVFYDNDYFYRLVREARKMGITVPIIAGILPLTNSKQAIKTIKLTGCSIPLSLRSMIERFKDDKQAIREIGINYAVYQILDLFANDVDGVHLYVMNNSSTAKEIIEKISNVLKKELSVNEE